MIHVPFVAEEMSRYESETNFILLLLSSNAQLFACCEERVFIILPVFSIGYGVTQGDWILLDRRWSANAVAGHAGVEQWPSLIEGSAKWVLNTTEWILLASKATEEVVVGMHCHWEGAVI